MRSHLTTQPCGFQAPFATACTMRLLVRVSLFHACLTVRLASAIIELTLLACGAMDLYDPYLAQLRQLAQGRLPNPAILHSFLDRIVHTSTKRRRLHVEPLAAIESSLSVLLARCQREGPQASTVEPRRHTARRCVLMPLSSCAYRSQMQWPVPSAPSTTVCFIPDPCFSQTLSFSLPLAFLAGSLSGASIQRNTEEDIHRISSSFSHLHPRYT